MARLMMPLLAIATTMAIAGGCGGDDDSPDKAEFIEQAQAACTEKKATLTDFTSWGEENGSPGDSPGELRKKIFENVQLPAIEAELAALRELDTPASGAQDFEAFVAAEERAIDAAQTAESTRSLTQMRRRFDAAAKLAEDYGISTCANPASTIIGE